MDPRETLTGIWARMFIASVNIMQKPGNKSTVERMDG